MQNISKNVKEEERHLESMIAEFLQDGEGEALHRELHQLARDSPTSWLEGFWVRFGQVRVFLYASFRSFPSPLGVVFLWFLQASPHPSCLHLPFFF